MRLILFLSFMNRKSDQKKETKIKKPKIKPAQKDQDLDEDEGEGGWKEVTGKGGVPIVSVCT